MKISTYTPGQISTTTVSTPNMQLASDANIQGDDTKTVKAVTNALGAWQKVIQQKQDEADQKTAFDAINEYKKQTYEAMYSEGDENGNGVGFMNLQGSAAADSSNAYIAAEKDIRADVLSRVKFHNKKNMLALQQKLDQHALGNYQTVDRHQYQQGLVAKKATINNGLDMSLKRVQRDYGNEATIGEEIQDGWEQINSLFPNMGDEQLEAMRRDYAGKVFGGALDAAGAANDTATFDRILKSAEPYMPAEQFAKYNKANQNRMNDNLMRSTIQSWRAAGLSNVEIEKRIANMELPGVGGNAAEQKEGTSWRKNHAGVNMDLVGNAKNGFNALAALYHQMSGGDQLIVTAGRNYDGGIHAEGENSHGAGVKIDTDTEWLRNADNRHKFIAAAQAMGVNILDEYENPSANSTGGHLDINLKGYNGGGSPGRKLDAAEMDKWRNYNTMLTNQEIHRKNVADMQDFKFMKAELFGKFINADGGMKPIEEALNFAREQAGNDPDRQIKFTNYVKSWYKAYGVNTTSGGKGTVLNTLELDNMIRESTSQQQFMDLLVEKGCNANQVNAGLRRWQQRFERKGVFSVPKKDLMAIIMGGAKESQLTPRDRARRDGAWQWLLNEAAKIEATENKGEPIKEYQLYQLAQEAAKENVYGGGWSLNKMPFYSKGRKFNIGEATHLGYKVNPVGDGTHVNVEYPDGSSAWLTYDKLAEEVDDKMNEQFGANAK